MAKAKTGLGKGLDLLIPKTVEDEAVQVSGKQMTLKLSQVEPNRNQPRKQFEPEALEELAESIKQYGIIQPIVVTKKDDYYEIIAGERRWRAAKKAGLKEVPVVIKEYTDKEIAEISLIENIQREDLNPIEEAKAYKLLIDEYKLTQDELSQRISKSRTAVTNTMRLLKLHENIQEMLIDGTLSAGHARALLGLENTEDQLKLAEKVVAENLSVRQTEDLVKSFAAKKPEKKKAKVIDGAYKAIGTKLTEALGTKVVIKQQSEGKGKIEISYFSDDQLDQLYKIINKGTL